MVSQYMKDNFYNPPNGKKRYRYVMSDGVPTSFTMPMSKHALAVLNGQSDTKFLRECEQLRFSEVTYGPPLDGVYTKEGNAAAQRRRGDRPCFYILNGNRSRETYSSWVRADEAFRLALAEQKIAA